MNESALIELLDPLVAAHDLEIDALKVIRAGKRSVVRISLDGDGSEGHGPDLDQIAEATRDISRALDESDAAGAGAYTLEVSSRGVSAPLTRPVHWRRNMGHLVEITPHEGEKFQGRIQSVDEGNGDDVTIRLDVAGEIRQIRLSEVGKAVVQIEMNRKARED